LFNLAEKLRIQLQKKEEEWAKEKQENQVCTLCILIIKFVLIECFACPEIVNRFGVGKSSSKPSQRSEGEIGHIRSNECCFTKESLVS
jgi:hypothetical protein